MFGRLKNLFKKRSDDQPFANPSPTLPPREFQRGYAPENRTPAAPPSRPQPVRMPPAAVAPAESSQPAVTGDSIRLLLKSILLKLPDALKARVRQPPTGAVYISLPLQKILDQLPQGSARITFGDLRLASPAGVFTGASDQDQTLIELSLPEIIAQLKPDQLPRRAAQKQIEVPEDVTGLFGDKGKPVEGVQMSSASAKTRMAPAPTPPVAPRQSTPASIPATAPKPAVQIKPISPLPPPSIKPTTPLPAPAGLKLSTPQPSHPLPSAASLQPPAPPPAAAPVAQPAAAPGPLVVPLAQLANAWPDAIKQILDGQPDAIVSLPSDEVEQGLRRGKLLFPWKRVRLLVKPALSAPADQLLDETLLELPLAVVAPLFLTRKRPPEAQKKYAVSQEIPDVFTGKGMTPSMQAQITGAVPSSAPVAPSIALPVVPAPIRPPPAPAAPAVVAAAQPVPQDIGEVFGQPGRKNWAPSEIVQKTGALKGVAGALIAMQDGLLVAGHLPPGLNSETIAAFLPQMFSRMMQYSKELKLGETNNLTFIVDNVPLKIFKIGGVFFTVIGRNDEQLPEPHLSIIAAQLAPQNK